MKKSFLITFEGGEGCGKSMQIRSLSNFLDQKKIDYIISREPGGTEIGEQIRNILLHGKGEISPNVETLLFASARAEHVEKVVKPALKEGKIVILDRFYDSSYAYQGYAGNIPLEKLEIITNFAIDGAVPDLTFLFDLSYEEGMKRKMANPALSNLDRFENKGKAYHDKVRYGYLELAKKYKDRYVVIDASKSREEIFNEMLKILKDRKILD